MCKAHISTFMADLMRIIPTSSRSIAETSDMRNCKMEEMATCHQGIYSGHNIVKLLDMCVPEFVTFGNFP